MNSQQRGQKTATGRGKGDQAITIKKYANRRLYNTATSSYVTLDHLCQMVKDGVDFVVYDAKTGEDITRSVLTQIIVEEEAKGVHLLPIKFLRQLIGFYGDSMQAVVPRYLEHMMAAFAENQDRLRQQMQETFGGMFPFAGNLEEMGKQNAALFESAMKMFTPFAAAGRREEARGRGDVEGGGEQAGAGREAGATGNHETLVELRRQVERLQQQLDALTREQQGGKQAAEGREPRHAVGKGKSGR